MSHVTFHVSHVTCHVSYVTCHLSHVTFHFIFLFLSQSGGASQWRLCYHWGLPRLVLTEVVFISENFIRHAATNPKCAVLIIVAPLIYHLQWHSHLEHLEKLGITLVLGNSFHPHFRLYYFHRFFGSSSRSCRSLWCRGSGGCCWSWSRSWRRFSICRCRRSRGNDRGELGHRVQLTLQDCCNTREMVREGCPCF